MSRAVTADHVLFDECIDTFRREQIDYVPFIAGPSKSFLITAFSIDQGWDLGVCTVQPSTKVILPGAYSAFISIIDNPEWVGNHNSHLFGIALSAIITFITHKVCKSTRDDYLCRRQQLSHGDLTQLALINPVLTAGPGFTHTTLSRERQDSIQQEVKNIIELLNKVDYKKYRIVMQSIRMVHLSLINQRDDFGLAYLLVVSSIEAIAQHAVKRDKVKQNHASKTVWQQKAKEDTVFAELFEEYKRVNGYNNYLKERYIKFILDYAPVDNWEEYVSHPMQDIAESIKDINPDFKIDHLVGKNWFEKYPNQLEPAIINEILADSYTHRSSYIHRGEQPPHKDPNPILNRFFQEYREYKDNYYIEEKLLPNYQLLLGISKNSLLNWLYSSK